MAAVRAWQDTLNARRDEVLESLADENVILEAVFLDQRDGGDFLVYVMASPDFAHVRNVAQGSTRAIDALHKKFKQDW